MAGYKNKVRPAVKEAMPFEVIEIGAVKLDSQLQIVDRFEVWIKPVVYKILDKHVAEVTKRYQDSLDEGVGFKQAVTAFFRWAAEKPASPGSYPRPLPRMPEDVVAQTGSADYLFATWSDSDTQPLRDNLRFHGLDPTLPARCLNVQKLFAKVANEGTGQQRSLSYALEFLEIKQSHDFHLALNDAYYTAQILRSLSERLMKKQSQEDAEGLPTWMQGVQNLEQINLTDWLWSYSYDPNLNYQTRIILESVPEQELMKKQIVNLQPQCPDCNEELYTLLGWKLTKSHQYGRTMSARYECSNHGRVSGQLKIRKDKNDIWHGRAVYRIERPYEL